MDIGYYIGELSRLKHEQVEQGKELHKIFVNSETRSDIANIKTARHPLALNAYSEFFCGIPVEIDDYIKDGCVVGVDRFNDIIFVING